MCSYQIRSADLFSNYVIEDFFFLHLHVFLKIFLLDIDGHALFSYHIRSTELFL